MYELDAAELGAARKDASATSDSCPLSEASAAYRDRGTLIVRQAWAASFISRLHKEFAELYTSNQRVLKREHVQLVGHRRKLYTIRLTGGFGNPDLFANPLILKLMSKLLGDEFIIQSINVVNALPGAKLQHTHTDHSTLFPDFGGLNGMLPPYAIHCGIPLVDLDVDTGSTALWEGSHRRSIEHTWDITDKEMDEMTGASTPWLKSGDCYFMDSRLLHRGMANLASHSRPILYLVFCRKWFSDPGNFSKQVPLWLTPGDYAALDDEHRALFQVPEYRYFPHSTIPSSKE